MSQDKMVLLQQDVNQCDTRIGRVEVKIDEHISEYANYRAREDERLEHQSEHLERLMKITESNSQSISDLAEATRGVVDMYEAGKGVFVFGGWIGKFGKWAASVAAAAAAIAWAWNYITSAGGG